MLLSILLYEFTEKLWKHECVQIEKHCFSYQSSLSVAYD